MRAKRSWYNSHQRRYCREKCQEEFVFRKRNDGGKRIVSAVVAASRQRDHIYRISGMDCLSGAGNQEHIVERDQDYQFSADCFCDADGSCKFVSAAQEGIILWGTGIQEMKTGKRL